MSTTWKETDYLLLLRENIVPKWFYTNDQSIIYDFLHNIFEFCAKLEGNNEVLVRNALICVVCVVYI